MILRFGPEHKVIQTIDKAKEAADKAWWTAIQNEHDHHDEHVSRRLHAASRATGDAVKAFLTIAGSTVGSG